MFVLSFRSKKMLVQAYAEMLDMHEAMLRVQHWMDPFVYSNRRIKEAMRKRQKVARAFFAVLFFGVRGVCFSMKKCYDYISRVKS